MMWCEALNVGPVIVIANLEAISTSLSALPAAVSIAQAGLLQRPGGFASTLAAAQAVSSTPQSAGVEGQASEGSAADGGAAITSNVRMQPAANLQGKKPVNGSPASEATTLIGVSGVLPGFIPATASQILPAVPPTTIPQSAISQPTIPQPAIPQPSLRPALTVVQQTQTSDDAAQAAAQNTSSLIAPSNQRQTTGIFSSSPSLNEKVGALTAQSVPGALVPDRSVPANQPEASMPNRVSLPGSSTAPGGAGSGASVAGSAPGDQGSSFLPNSSLVSSAESAAQPNRTVEIMAPAPTLLSTAVSEDRLSEDRLSEDGPAAGALLASADIPANPANSANVIAADTPVPTEASSQTGTEDPAAAVINGEISSSTILSAPAQPATGSANLRIAAAIAADTVAASTVRGAGESAAAGKTAPPVGPTGPVAENGPTRNGSTNNSSTSNSATNKSATGNSSTDNIATNNIGTSNSSTKNGSTLASQSPFSIFFSDSGPGVESAASSLPRMILPGTGPALRTSHMNVSSPPAASLGTSRPPSAVSSAASAENAGDAASGSESRSSQNGPPIPKSAELNAASAPLASPQNPAPPAPAPPIAAGTIPPAPPAVPADALPKPDALPGGAPSPSANLASPAGETLTTAAPGPVQLAQMISRAGQSEMRIGMNTSAFGSVEVRAVVHASDVGLVIGSEKGDLRSLLANDMPAITNALQQQSLRLNSVNFMQGFAFSNNASGGDSQQHSFVPAPRASAGSASSEAAVDDSAEVFPEVGFGGGSKSLSILA